MTSVRDAVIDNLSHGDELGLSLVVDIDGEVVVDIYGGWTDAERSRRWNRDTIVNVWSTTKTVTALAALMLVDRGALDLGAPVAKYWPEFGANGKDGIRVRHILSHTSGVSGWEPPLTLQEIYDWESASNRLASQAPWWEPGTASGYHPANYGQLVGELVRRTTGLSLKAFVAREIAGPLDADFQIGAAEKDWDRISPLVPPPPVEWDFDSMHPAARKTLLGPAAWEATIAHTPDWRRADLGAVNGHGNARSIAKILSVIALGGARDGVRLLSPATIDRIFDEQANGVDLVLGIPLRWGIGFSLPQLDTLPYLPEGRLCFWGGWGGSMIIMDLERRMTISYMMNKMQAEVIGSNNARRYCEAIYDGFAVRTPNGRAPEVG